MATFVLIHGAWQGAWCWDLVTARLRSAGHQVIAPDLPGHGTDSTPPATVTNTMYVQALTRIVESLSAPPIVVAHSTGAVIMQIGALLPDRVRALVYVGAIVPASGTTLMDVVQRADPDYLAQIAGAPDGATAEIRPEGARRYLYPLCPEDLVATALGRLTPEPVEPFQTRLLPDADNLSQVPAYYVETVRDAIIPIGIQREMQANGRVRGVFPIDSDHSPFYSAPDALTAHFELVVAETKRSAPTY